jgi:genome maintenance exonuclease 1
MYKTPKGIFPSVTTVLGATSDKKWLEKWKKAVGEEEAKRQSKRATDRGTALHDLFEKHLLGEAVKPNILDHYRWKSLVPVMARIDGIECVETALYSDTIGVAGRTDAIARFDGVLSVIDLKTSSKHREESDIFDYFVQESTYGIMYAELLNTRDVSLFPKRIVTILVNDEDATPQIFVKSLEPKYVLEMKKRVELFNNLRKKNGNVY